MSWTTNVGYPGYATAEIDEAFNTFILPDYVRQGGARRDDARGSRSRWGHGAEEDLQ